MHTKCLNYLQHLPTYNFIEKYGLNQVKTQKYINGRYF